MQHAVTQRHTKGAREFLNQLLQYDIALIGIVPNTFGSAEINAFSQQNTLFNLNYELLKPD